MNDEKKFWARKISRSKWEQQGSLAAEDVGADACTGDLRTSGNALSLWECSLEGVEDIVLALACAADRPAKICIVLIDKSDLSNFDFKDVDGETLVDDLKKSHVDCVSMSVRKICALSDIIAQNVRSEELQMVKTFTEKQICEIIAKSIDNKRLSIDKLKTTFHEKIRPLVKDNV